MKRLIYLLAFLAFSALSASAQRQQHLGRGVVATYHSSTGVTVSWRRLIQYPENAAYNVYVKKNGETTFSKLNAEPLKLTNYNVGASLIPSGSDIHVTMVNENGEESEPSMPFTFK